MDLNNKRGLARTPRTNDTIMEYYEKFGQNRDLEKFMRIYSPASSQDSQRTAERRGACIRRQHTKSRETISSNSSCEALAMMPVLPLSCCGVNSKSMPNIHEKDEGQELLPFRDVIVDINIELEEDKILSASSENLHTPKRGPIVDAKQTQTPDSVAKTHRRLEWDSLGDIGYRKSMSTSNISVMERSLLKEFFREGSAASEQVKSNTEGNVGETQTHVETHKQVRTVKANVAEHAATPPLACSTLVEGLSGKATIRGARPKMISQSTSSTSLQKKFEKYAQTSLIKPTNTHSQEIQVSMSSSTSVIEGTATPSSFEYYSSRSSKSRSSRSSGGISSGLSNTNIPPAQHPFITSITDLLRKRKALSDKSSLEKRKQTDSIKELQSKFQAALEENKENHSHTPSSAATTTSFSLTRQAPELDLGIQLICSLIDAKSVNGKQKKKLIRDIVKRITRLGDEGQEELVNSVSSDMPNVYDAVYSRRRCGASTVKQLPPEAKKGLESLGNNDLGVTPIEAAISNPMENNISNITINSTREQLENKQDSNKCNHGNSRERCQQPKQQILGNSNQQSSKISNKQTIAANEDHKKVPIITTTATKKPNNAVQSERIGMEKITANVFENEKHTLYIKKTRSTQTTNSSGSTKSKKLHLTSSTRTTSSGTTTTSSTSSHDLPTQKSLRRNINTQDMDGGDQPTMREWLNPLTQSEIEYEEKKREETAKKVTKQAVLKHEKKLKQHNCGRDQQLNWIENEIHRLECLKHLLLKDEHEKSSTLIQSTADESSSNKTKESCNSTQTNKLYDTVYSADTSSVLSESAERLVKEIEVILEESSEDITNLKDNSKRTRERRKETQILCETSKQQQQGDSEKVKFRQIKETTSLNENKQLPVQRQKIDTPNTTDQEEGSGSLRDMVKQRKQEFMASYKTKKQNHYDALKQQQREQSLFKYLPIKETSVPKERPPTGYYSVPHTINRKFSPTEYAYPQSNLPPTPEEQTSNSSIHVVYSTTTAAKVFKQNKETQKPSNSSTMTAATTTTTSSSTSMFCMSSDVSVPMGSNNVSSTPTTTHHYDDVAAAVAGVPAPSSESILCNQPILGHQLQPYFHPKRKERPAAVHSTISKTAAIQVKPKGIAYVIEFDNKNAPAKNLKHLTSNESVATFTTNNIKYLENLSCEPQLTLQDHLEKAKPNFLKHSKERKAILNKLQSMRQERDRQLRDIIDNTSFNSLERRLKHLPPPPIQKLRILKTKEMKALTNKRVASLPEVVARKQQEQEEKRRRGNRILRDVFNLRLQKRVRNGKLSLNHSKAVI